MDDRAERTWSALAEIFGGSLTSSFGATCPPLWAARIAALSDAQLEHGLRCMAEVDSPYAPSLGQFVTACKSARGRAPQALPQPTDHWHGALNRLLLSKLMRAMGVPHETLRALVGAKRSLAAQLRAAYGDGTDIRDRDRDDLRDIERGYAAQLDEIIAAARRPRAPAEADAG